MSKILIADDSMFQRKLMKDAVVEMGHEYIEAKNGQEALDLINDQNPDCLMLDLLMPVMDGIQLLEELKKVDSPLPRIVLSADIQESTISKCLELGALKFLNKPFKKDEFIASINLALNS